MNFLQLNIFDTLNTAKEFWVQSLCPVRLFVNPWTAAHQASLYIINSRSPPRPMSIELVMPSNHLILGHPLFLPPSIFPSIRVFSNESALRIRWPKYWSFSFSISPSNEHPGLISFRMDWLDLLAVQGNLKSLLQHHSSKASIPLRSAFFIVQLLHPFKTTGKTIALTRRTFVGKVMSLFFNMLSRLLITFLPRSKCLLISWLQSLSAVILEPRRIKSATASTVSPSICHEMMGPDAMILVLYSQQKQDQELTVAQIMNSLLPNSHLNWRKWGKPLDHFRYDLNQIPYDYTVEVRNRFKGLDLIDSAWWTMDGGSWHCTGDRDQDHPQEMQKSKMVVWGGLTNSYESKRIEIFQICCLIGISLWTSSIIMSLIQVELLIFFSN